jgi:hypothetical protein
MKEQAFMGLRASDIEQRKRIYFEIHEAKKMLRSSAAQLQIFFYLHHVLV